MAAFQEKDLPKGQECGRCFIKRTGEKKVSWMAMGRLLIPTISFPSLIILIIQNPLQPFSASHQYAEEKK